ncbi:hypothetical protein EVAR_103245_1 [Eumeta japonica]|uniref:Uncharacterized protein n=1 Tax=Eumeta variegata TaxID=151549 RepID=A0A4C1XAD0_EUMVA|nr:hypothetical protein EVAR_103245_1 [Eumeta japonica]
MGVSKVGREGQLPPLYKLYVLQYSTPRLHDLTQKNLTCPKRPEAGYAHASVHKIPSTSNLISLLNVRTVWHISNASAERATPAPCGSGALTSAITIPMITRKSDGLACSSWRMRVLSTKLTTYWRDRHQEVSKLKSTKIEVKSVTKIRINSVPGIKMTNSIEIRMENKFEIVCGTRMGIYLHQDRFRNEKLDRRRNRDRTKSISRAGSESESSVG